MLALALALQLVSAQPDSVARRFALVVGANDGGKERVTLRYAATDAHSVADVLTQIGGVARGDLVFIEEPRAAELSRGIDELARRLQVARETTGRLEVVFYYSGHSDERGLMLGQERFAYDELRRRLDGLPAEVRVAIVDACASGALTRSKGGVSRPPFLVDASTQLKGHAFLTSASIDEAAQESERLKASVFTHALVSGLRGAADSSRDGKVTLAEAYQFAFQETLARTASTRAGPQRPAFDIQLAGTGEMVLTDVRVASSQLSLEPSLAGRVFVLNAAGGLVVEVAKAAGASLELGVEPGSYRVLVEDGHGKLGQTTVALLEKQQTVVSAAQLSPVTKEVLVTRGDEPMPYLPVDVSFVYPLSLGGIGQRAPKTHLSFGVLTARAGEVNGAAISSLGGWTDERTRGVAIAGLLYRTGGLDGFAASGGAVISTANVNGLVVAPVAITAGSMRGLQAGMVEVVSDGLVGGQLGAVNFAAGGLTGLQVSAANVATGGAIGLQAGAANVAIGGFAGFQASATNVAAGGPTFGAQVGVLNVGGDVTGAQIGVLNIAGTVKGTQIGVLNIAKDATAPVGLLNVMTQGRFRAAAWVNETEVLNVAAKLGSKNVYSHLTVGLNPRSTPRMLLALGLGVHIDFGDFYGQVEAEVGNLVEPSRLFTNTEFLVATTRVVAGWQFSESFSLFAGPSLTHVFVFNGADASPYVSWGYTLRGGHRVVPGLVVGVQLF